jgi:hypothetical protein
MLLLFLYFKTIFEIFIYIKKDISVELKYYKSV